MTREVWFKEDLGQVLLAVAEASHSVGDMAADALTDGQMMWAYQTGFQAAVKSLALAFGLLDVAGSLPRCWPDSVDVRVERSWPRANRRWVILDG